MSIWWTNLLIIKNSLHTHLILDPSLANSKIREKIRDNNNGISKFYYHNHKKLEIKIINLATQYEDLDKIISKISSI